MKTDTVTFKKDHKFLRFRKGDEVDYLRGNDKVSEVLFNDKKIWIDNEYLNI